MAILDNLKSNKLHYKVAIAKANSYLNRLKVSLLVAITLCIVVVFAATYISGDKEVILNSLEVAITFSSIIFIFLFLVTKDDNPENMIKSGVTGENLVIKELKKLDDDFIIFNQITLPDERSSIGQRELDILVLSKKNIYIVEVKNNRGDIVVDAEAKEWYVEKVTQYNNTYAKKIRNPLRQIYAQNKVLNYYLRNKKIFMKMVGVVNIVVFANEEANLDNIYIKDDASEAVVCLEHLNMFIKHKEEYCEDIPSKIYKKTLKELELL